MQRWASGSSLARTPTTRLPQQASEILSRPTSTTSSSARASPITAISVYPRSSTSARGASAISCAMATRSTSCEPSLTAPSRPSLRWMRTRFLPATSRHRRLPPLTSTAASHAMNATSPPTTWWDSSALCLSSSIRQARALAREQGDIYRLLDAPFGITRSFTDSATQATWERLKDEMRDWLARA